MRKQTENFQAETKELLNLMVHSIYTNKEIFLRELISNGSDAIDKLKFKALTDTELLKDSKEFKIEIKADKDKNQLIIEDTGIGMTFDEVNENIGTIAKSGSKAFIEKFKEAKENEQLDIIGQFGVGFYSAFMVASDITLYTKSPYSDVTIKWSSKGDGTYEIEEIENLEDLKRGTRIVLTLNEDSKEFLEDFTIRMIVKKHSNSIKYPIYFGGEKLNNETPIWKKDKKDITEEEYNEFYKNTFYDHEDPLLHFHIKVQGSLEYTALIYVPKRTPMDFYTRDYKRGLQLYTKNVFIMEKAESLIPEHFSFMKGIVDTDNLSLNISREILQQDNELVKISKNIEKKIETELKKLLKDDREKYITMWEAFGRTIKFGIQDMFGLNKEKLQDLLIFKSSFEDKYTTLKEYVERMKDDQKEIYYVTGENEDLIKVLPKVKVLKDKGFEVLYLTDKIDEFTLKTMMNYAEKQFKSISDADFANMEDEKEKETRENLEKENRSLLDKIKDMLGGKIEEARFNGNLGSGAVGLASKGEISLEMEKTLAEIPGNEGMKAQKILELNPNHPLFEKIKNTTDEEELKDLVYVLYNQSLLVEGFAIENPVEFSEKLNKLIVK